MENFLTLVVLPANKDTLIEAMDMARSCLSERGATGLWEHWLCEDIACDIHFSGVDPREIEHTLRNTLNDRPVDLYCAPCVNRQKRAIIADMDSTIVTTETLDDMADAMGVKEAIADITARGLRGEIEFEDSVRTRLKMIAGMPLSEVNACINRTAFSPGARVFVRTMRSLGAYTALVSGGFTLFTEVIADKCGFHEHRANELEVKAKALTGEIAGPILGREAKLEAMDELAAKLSITRQDFLTIGDGANDLDMIRSAGLGIAYFGKPILLEHAAASIRYTDLTSALYFQGIPASDWAADDWIDV